MVDYAYIKIWDTLVGVVRWDDNKKIADFQYDVSFLSNGWDISPIKMTLSNGNRIYSFPELTSKDESEANTFNCLPGLLADSLPDKYGNQLIERWLAQNGRTPASMNPVEKLCFIGKRGMGALEFEPAHFKSGKNSFSVEVDSLVETAAKMLSDRTQFKTKLETENEMQDILKVGTSAGGARPKAVIAYNNKTGEVRSGQANAPKGFEHWLIKLDGVSGVQFGESLGWGRVEYAYYLMAKECSILMTDCKLFEENKRAHFMTKRFDRGEGNVRHHIQTFCGIQHFDYNLMDAFSYEQLFQTMRTLRLTYPEAEQMFRRMVFNVLATNCDDHTKNFSFMMKKNGRWELAPAYDVCFAYDPENVWVNRQTLSINGKNTNITKEDLMTIAKENNIKKAEQIIYKTQQVLNSWDDFASTAGVRDDLRERIEERLFVNFANNG